jgi:transposase
MGGIQYGMKRGDSVQVIAHHLQRHRSTVYRWKARFLAKGNMNRAIGSGRPSLTSQITELYYLDKQK